MSTPPDLEKLRSVARDIRFRMGMLPSHRGVDYKCGATSTGWGVFCDGKEGGRRFHSPLLTVRKDGCESREISQGDLAEALALFLAHGYELLGFAERQLEADALAKAEPSKPAPCATPSDLVPFMCVDVNRLEWVSPETPLRIQGRYMAVQDRPGGGCELSPEVWIGGRWVEGWFPSPANLTEHEISIRFRGLGWTPMDLDKLRLRLDAALPRDRAEREYWPTFFGEKSVVVEGGTK